MHRRGRGFTLIELLVVVAIISLLVSLLAPSLSKSRELAVNVSCRSNMHQIGYALAGYVSENGGVYPPYYSGAFGSFKAPRWMDFLKIWVPDDKTHLGHQPNNYSAFLFCPGEPNHHLTLIDYAVNVAWPPSGPIFCNPSSMKADQVKAPASRVAVCDSRFLTASGYMGSWNMDAIRFFASTSGPGPNAGPYPPRHGLNMNFLFAGEPFGGDSFVPHLNSSQTGRKPDSLDAIVPTDPVFINVDNHSGVVPLRPSADLLERAYAQLRAGVRRATAD